MKIKNVLELAKIISVPIHLGSKGEIQFDKMRRNFLSTWKYRCGCCDERLTYNSASGYYLVEIDHFFPLSMGGSDSTENKWPLCLNCHRAKTQMERQKLFQKPWCPICNKYYTGAHECFEQRRLMRGVDPLPYVAVPLDNELPHPDTWLSAFGYKGN